MTPNKCGEGMEYTFAPNENREKLKEPSAISNIWILPSSPMRGTAPMDMECGLEREEQSILTTELRQLQGRDDDLYILQRREISTDEQTEE